MFSDPAAAISSSPARMPERRLVAYIVCGLIAAVVCAYAMIVRADFIDFDDNNHVFQNPVVTGGLSWQSIGDAFTKYPASLWIPLTWISFMVDVSLFGLNPGAMHAVNLAWHTASTVLLFLTLRRLTGHLWASAFIAALFGLHPINVESVAWVTERKNVLSTFFWLAAIAAYARYAGRPRALAYSLVLLAAALAMLSKAMAVTLPCTLLLLDVWPLQRVRAVGWTRLVVEKLPLFLLSAVTSWFTICAQRTRAMASTETLSVAERLSNALLSSVAYLRQLFWPADRALFYPHPVEAQPLPALAAGLFLLAITIVVWLWRKRHPVALIGWLWFLGTLVPVIGLVQVGSQARADRFTYIPQLGLFLAVTWLVKERWSGHPRLLRFIAIPMLAACALLTARQVNYWQDGATLFEHTIAVTENNACAFANAGLHRARAGEPEKAIPHFQASLRVQPDQAMIWKEFGAALNQTGRPKEAVEAFRMGLQYAPEDSGALYQLGVALQGSGATEQAIAHFEQILRDVPNSAGSHYHLGLALESKGRKDEARAHFQEAARLAPTDAAIAEALRRLPPTGA